MKKLLSILMLLVAIVTGAWASTVNDLATISSDYTFISDNVTSSGTAGLTGGTLYDSNKILSVGGNSAAKNKGNSTFGDATHLNSLRIKGDQNQLAFKVAGACTITFYQQSHSSRKLQAGTSSYSNNLGSGGTSTTSWTLDLSSLTGSTVIYLSSTDPSNDDPKKADLYIAGFVVTMIASPTITAVDAASIKATTSGVDATTNINIQGSNLTGSTLTATLSPEVEGLSVGLASSAITAGAINTTATLTYNRTANVKQGTTTLTISDGTTSKEIAVTYSAYITPWTLQSISESTTWTFDDSNITSGSINKNTSAIYANIEGMTFGNDFDATALELGSATWPYYSNAHIAQAKSFKFNTTVPGTVKVTYNKAGGDLVYISVNGGDNGSASSTTTTDAIVVGAGDVTIAGYGEAEHTTEALMNVSKIEFTATPWTLTYDGNGNDGGDVPAAATLYEDGATPTVLDNTGSLTNGNLTFSGWNTETDGTGTAYAAGSTLAAMTADVTLYAQWEELPLVTMPTEEKAGYSCSVEGVVKSTASNVTLHDQKVYEIAANGNITITVPATTNVSKIIVSGTTGDTSHGTTVTITGENEESASGNFNDRKNAEVFITFVPTTQTQTYTISSPNYASWVKVAIYGTEGPATETITTDNGVATYVTKNALDFTGLETKAYVVTGVNAGKTKVLTQEVTTVPAGTPLLIKGNTVDVPVIEDADAPATNLFQVSNGSVKQNTDKTIFVYSKTAKAFKRLGTATIPNGKCYIIIEGVPEATQSLDVDIEGEATAITNVNANENANSAAPVKIIKNGKLYIGNYNVAGQLVK